MLAAWGSTVHRFRWPVLILSLAPLVPALVVIARGARFDSAFVATSTESGRAAELVERQLPSKPPSFGLIFSSRDPAATDPAFRAAVERALAPLRKDPRVARITTPYDGADPSFLSRDGRRARVVVELTGRASPFESMVFSALPPETYPALRGLVASETLEVTAFGTLALHHDFVEMATGDLLRCEAIALPVVLLLLLVVFGSAVAAGLPLVVGVLAVVAGSGGTVLLARYTSVSTYATSVVSMIGLGVAIDYSLFLVSRFREELARRRPPDALAQAMGTAGKAVLFSGLTVAIGFLGMTLVPVGAVASLGLAGTLVVALSLFYSLTLLPAALAILGPRVDALRIPFVPAPPADGERGLWHRVATVVMARPWPVLLPVLLLLVVLGLPFRWIELRSGDARVLPASAESRRGDGLLRDQFPGGETDPIVVVLRYTDGDPLAADHVGGMYDLSRRLGRLPGVTRVDSVVDLDPSVTREQYQQLAALSPAARPAPVRALFAQTVGPQVATLIVHTAGPAASDQTRALVRTIRAAPVPPGAELLVTGRAAFDVDFADLIVEAAPRAVGFVLLATYLVLFVLLGSVVLPLKAVVMNVLSITASYGALVWIFQTGHLASWLAFTPGPIEPPIPLIMFCVLFGLSMDYEVLLLSRTREEHERTGDNAQAVAASLQRTGRLITGAAAIMAVVFFGFGLAQAVAIKAIGIGMGLAVVVDATIVRALLVPATMRLLGRWNWWAPAPLTRLHRRLASAERAAGPAATPPG